MELFHLTFFGKILRLEASMAGWQQLYWGESIVSQISASESLQGKESHQFQLTTDNQQLDKPAQVINCRVESQITWQPFLINYAVYVDEQLVEQASRNEKDIETQRAIVPPQAERKFSLIGLGSLVLKLFKSAKVIKVAFAGASLAAYSWFFSFQFALALIACLVFHEYGHIRAMKYFGLKTKGIYLVPFFGGLAVSDEKINTRWQDVVISIMGPTFGLLMSLLCVLVYWLTGEIFFAGLATFNALLNLFNLLPILPLDGGHILKSISFSMHSVVGLLACIFTAIAGVLLSYQLGLALLGFLLLIGSLEIVLEWRSRFNSHLLPLNRYGQIVSSIWYLLTVSALLAIIFYFADKGEKLLSLPLLILSS